MSLDLDIQRYKRELERQGADPRAIAAGLLGVTHDRYLAEVVAPLARGRVALAPGERAVTLRWTVTKSERVG